ncbi:MAG: 2-C-methyl-D-erythritol 4-phosphate cytidylyltransferase [Oscillospiraceae bacterium]|nr:2-C-methyl-D-erythritol 4-phosphate cytidylyltransferase [Oscillospiraceae bacterium]
MSRLTIRSESKRKKRRLFCSAVIVAAGSSERFGRDKLLTELGGVPVLALSIKAFEECTAVDEIIVVTRAEKITQISGFCIEYGFSKVTKVVCGGKTRTESALAGVSEINKRSGLVAIHDGARPFVTNEIIENTIDEATRSLAAAPAIPLKDTVKLAKSGIVTETVDRTKAKAVQTPQIFDADIIKAALTDAIRNGFVYTDDCQAAESFGVTVRLTEGSETNIKITTPADIDIAEVILRNRGMPL